MKFEWIRRKPSKNKRGENRHADVSKETPDDTASNLAVVTRSDTLSTCTFLATVEPPDVAGLSLLMAGSRIPRVLGLNRRDPAVHRVVAGGETHSSRGETPGLRNRPSEKPHGTSLSFVRRKHPLPAFVIRSPDRLACRPSVHGYGSILSASYRESEPRANARKVPPPRAEAEPA